MTDVKYIQNDVAHVRTRVENIERMIAHQIRNDPLAKQAATNLFKDTPDMARVYLAFDEPANQQEIIKKLGLDKSKVSRLVKLLVEQDYLCKIDDGRYMWTGFERYLKLSTLAKAQMKVGATSGKSTREGSKPSTAEPAPLDAGVGVAESEESV